MSLPLGLAALLLSSAVIAMRATRLRGIAAPLAVAFALRAFLAVIDAVVFTLPGHSDSLRFDAFANYWARNGVAGTLDHFGSGAALYTWVVSVFYALFDRSALMMQALNALFGALVVENVWRLTLAISNDHKQARLAAWCVAIFPSLVYFSSVLLREVAVAYPLSLGVCHLALWQRDRKPKQAFIGVAAIIVSMSFHSGSLAVLLAGGAWLAGTSVRAALRGQYRQLLRSVVALSLAAVAAFAVTSSGFGMEKFSAVEAGGFEDIGVQQGQFARGRTAYLADVHPETAADLVWQLPLRLTYFLFAPFPWMLADAADLVGVIDSLFFLYLSTRIWRARRELPQYPRAAMVFGVFAAMAVTFAVGVSNYGTAHRHRNKMLPLLVAAAMALPTRRRSRQRLISPVLPASAEPRLPRAPATPVLVDAE